MATATQLTRKAVSSASQGECLCCHIMVLFTLRYQLAFEYFIDLGSLPALADVLAALLLTEGNF